VPLPLTREEERLATLIGDMEAIRRYWKVVGDAEKVAEVDEWFRTNAEIIRRVRDRTAW
jgi:class 3 adenylate cyclase